MLLAVLRVVRKSLPFAAGVALATLSSTPVTGASLQCTLPKLRGSCFAGCAPASTLTDEFETFVLFNKPAALSLLDALCMLEALATPGKLAGLGVLDEGEVPGVQVACGALGVLPTFAALPVLAVPEALGTSGFGAVRTALGAVPGVAGTLGALAAKGALSALPASCVSTVLEACKVRLSSLTSFCSPLSKRIRQRLDSSIHCRQCARRPFSSADLLRLWITTRAPGFKTSTGAAAADDTQDGSGASTPGGVAESGWRCCGENLKGSGTLPTEGLLTATSAVCLPCSWTAASASPTLPSALKPAVSVALDSVAPTPSPTPSSIGLSIRKTSLSEDPALSPPDCFGSSNSSAEPAILSPWAGS